MARKHVLPKNKTIKFDDYKFTVKLHYDDLSDDKLQKVIGEVKNTLPSFKTLFDLKENDVSLREVQLYIYNNESNYLKHINPTISYESFNYQSNSVCVYQSSSHPGGITLKTVMKIAHNRKFLPNKATIELPEDNLQMDLYYDKLSNRQLEVAKQEIKSTFYDFKKEYGMTKYDTVKTINIFIHDNEENFKYAKPFTSHHHNVGQADRNSSVVSYIYHNIHDDESLRTQVSYALSNYNGDWDENKILLNTYVTIEIPESNVEVKLVSNSLSDKQIETAKVNITDAFKNLKFNTPFKIELNKYYNLDGLDDNILVQLLKKAYPNKDYDQESAKEAFEDPIVQRDIPILLSTNGTFARSQVLLSNTETIKFPRYNLEVDLHYRDLDDHQVWRAKQEIKNTIYDFKESFALKASNDLHKFRIFMYDNWNDYNNYTGSSSQGHFNGTYAHAPLTSGYNTLRHELMHGIISYAKVDAYGALPSLLNHSIVYYMGDGIYPARSNEFYGAVDYANQYLTISKFEADKQSSYLTIEFFQEIYPELIHEIYYNRKPYDSALEFFKAKFPDMVSHIPDSERDSYQKYDEKLLNKIFENEGVKQKLLAFIEAKLDEKKYIDQVNDINAFRVVKGDHIGTDKQTGEEYYTGIIVDDKGEIGSFSPVEYSYSPKGIKAFNHATKDSITIPRKYHNLNFIKVDSNFKLTFCDKNGNEYRDTQACKSKTNGLVYTDDALEAFTLVDLNFIKGITEVEQNLGKVLSIKPTNSKFSPISIYDGNKNIGSFTNEAGYVNRNKFYFKDEHSTDFKVYDENRALITIAKEDGQYHVSLRDGQYIDDDSKFLSQSIQLDGNNVNSVHYLDRETGKISKIEHSLLFKHPLEKEETIDFDEYNFTIKLHHDLSDDRLQKAINEIKNNLPEFKTLLGLKENDVFSHELQLYMHNDKSSYQKHTGSSTMYGHFNPKSNSMYFDLSDNKALEQTMIVAQNERVLPNRVIIELPNEKLQIDLYYNNLTDKQLDAAKQEIKSTFYDFKNLYGVKQYGTDKTLSIFLHDDREDYDKYAYTKDEGMGQYNKENTNIVNIYYNIHNDPEGTLRHQVSYALTFYNGGWDRNKILPDKVDLSSDDNNLLNLHPPQDDEEIEEIIEFDEYNFTIKLHHDLSGCKLRKAINEIKNTLPKFKTLFDLEESGRVHELQLYIYNNEYEYRKHTGSLANCGYFDPKLSKMYIYQTTHESGGITLGSTMEMAIAKAPITEVEIVKFPQYNFEVELHYDDLNNDQLARAVQIIKNTVSNFEKTFGLKESNSISEEMQLISPNNPDVARKFQIYLYNNDSDYKKYAKSTDTEGSDGRGIYITYSYLYKHSKLGIEFSQDLQDQVSYALSYYNSGSIDKSKVLPDITIDPSPDSNHKIQFIESVAQDNGLNEEKIVIHLPQGSDECEDLYDLLDLYPVQVLQNDEVIFEGSFDDFTYV